MFIPIHAHAPPPAPPAPSPRLCNNPEDALNARGARGTVPLEEKGAADGAGGGAGGGEGRVGRLEAGGVGEEGGVGQREEDAQQGEGDAERLRLVGRIVLQQRVATEGTEGEEVELLSGRGRSRQLAPPGTGRRAGRRGRKEAGRRAKACGEAVDPAQDCPGRPTARAHAEESAGRRAERNSGRTGRERRLS
eukprot:scaffold19077_cov184-Isochrysis_galbana.AAC.2